MTLGNIGKQPAPLSWLNKGWSSLQDYAHSAITHFKHEAAQPAGAEAAADQEHQPSGWGILAADVVDHNNAVEVRFEVPGMDKKDLQVEFAGGHLVVSGQKHMSSSREEGGCLISERAFGHFRRAIPMPAEIDETTASATYDAGVLIIKIGKKGGKQGTVVAIG